MWRAERREGPVESARWSPRPCAHPVMRSNSSLLNLGRGVLPDALRAKSALALRVAAKPREEQARGGECAGGGHSIVKRASQPSYRSNNLDMCRRFKSGRNCCFHNWTLREQTRAPRSSFGIASAHPFQPRVLRFLASASPLITTDKLAVRSSASAWPLYDPYPSGSVPRPPSTTQRGHASAKVSATGRRPADEPWASF